MWNCSIIRLNSSNDFQLFKKQMLELLGFIFTDQIWGFSEQPVLFWVQMGQRTGSGDGFCVDVVEIESKSKMTCLWHVSLYLLSFTLGLFLYSAS